jgi:hypothetical protein
LLWRRILSRSSWWALVDSGAGRRRTTIARRWLPRESHWRLVVAWGGLLVLRIARSRSRLLLLLLLLPCLLLL